MTFCLQMANKWCMENCKGKNEDDECILWLENREEFEKMKAIMEGDD